MRIADILWPWGALTEARLVIKLQRAQIDKQASNIRTLSEEVDDASRTRDECKLRLINAEIEINRLRRVIGVGHFRNPETGRLGPKGQTFGVNPKP